MDRPATPDVAVGLWRGGVACLAPARAHPDWVESGRALVFSLAHVLFGKPVSTFPGHALTLQTEEAEVAGSSTEIDDRVSEDGFVLDHLVDHIGVDVLQGGDKGPAFVSRVGGKHGISAVIEHDQHIAQFDSSNRILREESGPEPQLVLRDVEA